MIVPVWLIFASSTHTSLLISTQGLQIFLGDSFLENYIRVLLYEGGFEWMRHSISNTAEYGDFSRGSRIITNDTKEEMKKILEEIQSGAFAKEWMAQAREGSPYLQEKRKEASEHEIEHI